MAEFVTNHKSQYETLSNVVASQPLSGKSALITGAGRGVGNHLAHAFARGGAERIGILGRDKSRIEKARDELAGAYPKTSFIAFAADVTDEGAVRSVFETFGAPDILVNNAGHFPDEGPFVKEDLQSWFSGFRINVLGTATVTQAYLRHKSLPKVPIVLNVSSMAAHMRFPLVGWSGYNGSKTAQARIFESIRFEHPDVRFINIHPGQIESDGFTRSGASAPPEMTSGALAGDFYVWASTDEASFLNGRFVWAEWDIEELKAKESEILEKDLLLLTVDGFVKGF